MPLLRPPLFILLTPPPEVPPSPVEDPSTCQLLGPTALIVQGLMGIFVVSSLVVKRQFEQRKRPWRIWLWDVSKQLVGQAMIHALNLLISSLVAQAANNNPCSLYFLNVLIDTTIGIPSRISQGEADGPGVAIFYFALLGLTWVFTVRLGLEGFVSGQYGNPPRPRFWWQQLAPYLLSIILMKLLVLLPLTLPHISVLLLGFGHGLLDYLSPSAQVIFVMAIFPLVVNVIQFCLVDQVIKAGNQVEKEEDEEEGGYTRVLTREADHEPAPRALSVSTARRRGSTVKSRSTSPAAPTTPNTPNSPLLSPADRKAGGLRSGYGSTTPSPGASMDDGTSGVFWASLIRPSISAEGITESSTIARSADSSSLGEEGMLRPRHGTRSGAPSPDSLRYDGATSVVIEPSDFSAVCSDSPLTAVSTASKLSDELRREARNSLSPKMRRSVPGAREEGEGWGLTDLEH